MFSPIRGTTQHILANNGNYATPRMKKSHMLFNNIVAPTGTFVHVPVGKVGDYPIGMDGAKAKPEKPHGAVGETG
jgi:hypothetical protein